MLLCVSSTTLFQAQNTPTTNGTFIPDSQVTELYKIVKQNDYLKKRNETAEKALNEANKMIGEYKSQRSKLDAVIALQSEELKTTSEMYGKQIDVKNMQLTDLNRQLDETTKQGKKTARKKFWNGFAFGGVTVGIIGTATVFYLITK